jgi:hypothetical protein
MYSSLNLYGQSSSAVNKRYPCPNMALPTYHVKEKTPVLLPKPKLSRVSVDKIPRVSFDLSSTKTHLTPSYSNDKSSSSLTLLPVMDPRFNLREICKQCVLLEDHLTHADKRCTDCCTKHFLTIEALAEEALTLDKDQLLQEDVKGLPRKIRELEMMWMQNPSKCAEISQKLREIRKQFQEKTFMVIEESCGENGGSACSVRL